MKQVSTMKLPAIQDLVRKSFTKTAYSNPGDIRRVFHLETNDWTTDRKRIQEIDNERFAEVKTEGASSAQRTTSQGYAKEIVRRTISVDRPVTGEAFKALTAHGLAAHVKRSGEDVRDKIELDMRNFIGYGDTESYVDNGGYTLDTTTGDGKALFSTDHTLKHSSRKYSNILPGGPSVSETSLEDAEDYFNYNVVDNYGQRVSMTPNTIITSKKASVKNRVRRLLGSDSPQTTSQGDNSNSGVMNTYKNKYQHLAIEFDVDSKNITDSSKSYWWYLMALGGTPEQSFQAYYVNWMSPQVAPVEINEKKFIMSHVARAAYGIGAVSARGAMLSKATS